MTTVEPLSPQVITQGLKTNILGRRVVCFDRISSTNDLAKQLAEAGEIEGTIVIANEQTVGRGRSGRVWHAPPGSSILMTLVLRPRLAPHQAQRVTMVVALGLADAIAASTGHRTQIKWPNDILLNGHKCAGVLSESGVVGDEIEYLLIGCGVNVNFAAASVPGLPASATTIADEVGRYVARVPLLQAILVSIERYYVRLCRGDNLTEEFAERLATLYKSVQVQTPWGLEEGIAEAIDDDGALMLRRRDGSVARLVAGDVTLSRG